MPVAVESMAIRSPRSSKGVAEPETVMVSVAEAAKLCKCSDDTIRRRLRDGRIDGAYQEGIGDAAPWRIPVTGLVEAGLCGAEVLTELDDRLNPNVARLNNLLVLARAELVVERANRESAERLLTETKGEVVYLRKTVDHLLVIADGAAEGRSS
jgi:hypothetical protein